MLPPFRQVQRKDQPAIKRVRGFQNKIWWAQEKRREGILANANFNNQFMEYQLRSSEQPNEGTYLKAISRDENLRDSLIIIMICFTVLVILIDVSG